VLARGSNCECTSKLASTVIIMESSSKRRRIHRSASPTYELDHQDDSYEPYVPVAQRRQEKLAKLSSWGVNSEKEKAKKQQEELEEREDAEREEERRRENARNERTLLMEAQDVHSKKALEGVYSLRFCVECSHIFNLDSKKTEGEKAEEADAEILAAIKSRRKLASDMELAKGIQYTDSLNTT
jgi:ATP-dependent RNA helicase DDX41